MADASKPKRDKKGRLAKGSVLNPTGRPPGPNKLTSDMRAAIAEAATHAGNVMKVGIEGIEEMDGGVAYLTLMAINNPKTFAPLLSKLAPNLASVDVNVAVKQDDIIARIHDGRRRIAGEMIDVTPVTDKLKEALSHEDT